MPMGEAVHGELKLSRGLVSRVKNFKPSKEVDEVA